MPRRPIRLLLITWLLTASPCLAQVTGGVPPSDSAAAARQLDLGEQWFRSVCLECHAVRGLDDDDFRLKWGGRNAYDLFERIRSTMPQSNPGTLSQATYLAIVAYLMKLNGMPVGARRVSSDSTALTSIRLTFPAAPAANRR